MGRQARKPAGRTVAGLGGAGLWRQHSVRALRTDTDRSRCPGDTLHAQTVNALVQGVLSTTLSRDSGAHPEHLQGFRHHVALLSLPRLCGTTSDTIPMMPGFLRRPSQIPERLLIERQPFALHIGLVWASGADNKDMYADKSMSLEPLMGLFDPWRQERFVVIHSLQVGKDADQLEPRLAERGVVDHSKQIDDFLDTACLISQFDLVISVDTAVATSLVPLMCRFGPCFSTMLISAGCAAAVTPPGIAP